MFAVIERVLNDIRLTAPPTPPAVAAPVPAYNVASLPAAASYPPQNGVAFVVAVLDNPQGFARSTGTNWVSEVDGSDLGPGGG